MSIKLFAVVDRVTGIFDGPHKSINSGAFLREFEKLARDPNTSVGQKPEDFYAVIVGEWDENSGTGQWNEGGPTRIADATDFVVAKENNE